MKNSLFLGSTLGLLLLAGTASAEKIKYKATLNGDQQVPAVTTTAAGTAEIEFDTEAKTLSGTVTYEGVEATAAHIHEGACGEANPTPAFDFEETASPITFADVPLEDAEVTALQAGKYYINIHSEANPGGEIRGQILAEDSEDKCPAEGDGKGDGGGGGNGDGSGGGNGDGSGGGKADGGANSSSSGSAPASTDSGCSTTASAPGSGIAIALGIGMAVAAMKRGRRKR